MMDRREGEGDIGRKAEEFLRVFRKGEEFTQELLKENERLRYQIVKLQEEKKMVEQSTDSQEMNQLRHKLKQLEEDKLSILSRFKEVEEENKGFATRYLEVEEENNNLANLYVASHQLHSTLDFEEIVRIIIEIMINLIGAERFAIMLLDEPSGVLTPAASEGMEPGTLRKIKLGEGVIGRVAQTGESHFENDLENFKPSSPFDPIVCIPLRIRDQTFGVIALFSLLEQKKKMLTRVDEELFSMLAGHAATAIFSAKLYSQSERKLSTIQGFIDLLSGSKS
jgi:nitrate/nitrite-specific signal transduction histidine kinase